MAGEVMPLRELPFFKGIERWFYHHPESWIHIALAFMAVLLIWAVVLAFMGGG